MTSYAVAFAPEARTQLLDLQRCIAAQASPDTAARYADATVDFCEGLCASPFRGRAREDLRPAIRLTTFRSRAVVAYQVPGAAVTVVGIFYGGQDFGAALRENS